MILEQLNLIRILRDEGNHADLKFTDVYFHLEKTY